MYTLSFSLQRAQEFVEQNFVKPHINSMINANNIIIFQVVMMACGFRAFVKE